MVFLFRIFQFNFEEWFFLAYSQSVLAKKERQIKGEEKDRKKKKEKDILETSLVVYKPPCQVY